MTQSWLTLCDPMDCSTLGLPVHHQFPEPTQTHVYRISDAIQPSHPLSSPSPPAFNLSQHRCLFQWVHSLHKVAKVLEFQLQHQSSNEYSGLISFRMDWLDLLAVQGTLKSLLQHHSSKAETLLCQQSSSSQGYGFSCGHVWMWELDCEEGWAPKNWCFWTLEKWFEFYLLVAMIVIFNFSVPCHGGGGLVVSCVWLLRPHGL